MRTFLILLTASVLFLCGCGSKSVPPNLEGFWHIDINQSSLGTMPQDAKTQAAMRVLAFTKDGAYAFTGTDKPDNGKWTLDGRTVKLTSATGAKPPDMNVSDDGTRLTASIQVQDETVTFVFVRNKQ